MKTKNFQDYLEKRLNKAEIADIKRQARREKAALNDLQDEIAEAIQNYMSETAQ